VYLAVLQRPPRVRYIRFAGKINWPHPGWILRAVERQDPACEEGVIPTHLLTIEHPAFESGHAAARVMHVAGGGVV
jgi:hypothetical protein